MQRTIGCLCLAMFFFGTFTTHTAAQENIQGAVASKPILMDWKPDSLSSLRYTIAISPIVMMNSGMKVDFEMELSHKGRWLQFSLMGYYASKFSDQSDVWNTFTSSFDDFSALKGAGIGVAYKQMINVRGWYLTAGALVNYYDVGNYQTRFVPMEEDGLIFWRPKKGLFYTKYYKPMVQFNVGKFIPLSRRVFLDISTGLGYAYSFYDKDKHNGEYDGMYGFAYRGIEWNFGFRIGGLLGKLY